MSTATETYIKQLVEDRQTAFDPMHEQIRTIRQLRHGKNPIEIPEVYKATTKTVHTPIIADILYRVVATLSTDEPSVSAPPYADTEEAKRNSSLRERWSSAAMDRMSRDAGRNVYRMGLDAACSDGIGIWKTMDRHDVWTGLPRRKRDENGDEEDSKVYLKRADKFVKGKPFPFIWTDVDPLTLLWVNAGYGRTEYVEVSERPLIPAMKTFGVKALKGSDKKFEKLRPGEAFPMDTARGNQTVRCYEHWDADGEYVTYMLDDEIVDQRKVNYGRPPYFPFGGHMTSSRQPEEQYNSVVQPFAHLIPPLESLLTMMTNLVYLAAYPYLVQENADQNIIAGPANPVDMAEIRPGMVLRNVKFLEMPSTSRGVVEMINLLNLMIDRSGLAAVMYGQGNSSSSGYMVSQLMTAAQLVYAPIVNNAKMALEQMIPFIWQLVERIMKRQVFVWGAGTQQGAGEWMGLGKDDIDGYYACNVGLKPLLPMDKFAERQSAAQMVEAGLWTKENALVETGTEQPEVMLDDVAAERAVDSEVVMESIVRKAMERKGLIEPPPPPPPVPPAPVILGPNGMPINQGMPQGAGMPGQQFMPTLPDLTTPPGMPQPGAVPMPGPMGGPTGG